jgi:U4/U6 small nuclear ribonucleoprotein PRP3
VELIAQKRAEIAAKHAAMMKKNTGLASTVGKPTIGLAAPVPKVPLAPVSLPSKVVYNSTPSPAVISSGPTPASSSSVPKAGTPAISDDLVRKVAEAKRRVADAQSKLAIKDNPYMVCIYLLCQYNFLFKQLPQTLAQSSKKKGSGAGTPVVEQTQQGAGLKMTAHPLLLDQTPIFAQTKKERYKPMQPKFASIKANTRNQPTPTPTPSVPVSTPSPAVGANPYTASSANAGPSFEGAPRERTGRKFHFVQKGKYVALGNQMRQEIQLEGLKQRIAESARKAGLDGDMGIEKTIKVTTFFCLFLLSRHLIKSSQRAPPPESEWWDAALLPTKNYDDIQTFGIEGLNINNHDSPITIYIQHPIPIPAPDANKVALKPMMLTKKVCFKFIFVFILSFVDRLLVCRSKRK